MSTKLTAKQERFCLEMVKTGAKQVDVYKAVFKPKKMARKTLYEAASRLMATSKIQARISELMAPLVVEAQLTREQWIKDGMKLYEADPRKLFDSFNNPIPIAELGDNEITLLEGFKHKEEWTEVKKADGGKKAENTGYQDDYKITGFKARHEYIGKAMGFYKEKSEVELGGTLADLVLGSLKHDE